MNIVSDNAICGEDLMIKMNKSGIIEKLQEYIDDLSIKELWVGDHCGNFYVREDMESQTIFYTDPNGNEWEVTVNVEIYCNNIEEIILVEPAKKPNLFKSFFNMVFN